MRSVITSFAFVLTLLSSASAHALPWTTNGPYGGFIHSLAVAPSNPDRIYVGTERGLYRSDDDGVTWIEPNQNDEGIYFVVVDPAEADTIYLGSADTVYKSEDAGVSWQPLDLPHGILPTAFLIDPRDTEVLYIGSNCQPFFKTIGPFWHEAAGVYKSTDGGETWSHSGEALDGFQQCVVQLALDPVDPDTLYATPLYTDGGYARSDDGAESWTTASGLVPGGSVVADPDDPARRYGTTGHSGRPHFLVSTDSGATWSALEPQILGDGPLDPYFFGPLVVDPQKGRLFLGTTSGAFRSGDGGATWLPLEGAGRDAIHGLAFDPSANELTIGTPNGLFRSDGYPWNQWTEIPIPFIATGIARLVTHPSDPRTLCGWSGNRIYLSSDVGRSWEPLGDVVPASSAPAFRARDLDVGPDGVVYVLGFTGSEDQLLKLDPSNGTWLELTPPPSPLAPGRSDMKFVEADPHRPGEIYVGQIQEIAHTVDGGQTWEQLPIPFSYLSGFAIDPENTDLLYAATGFGIMKSTDRGHSWTLVAPLDDASHLVNTEIVISSSDPDTIYSFTNFFGLVDRSFDGGETWTQVQVPGELTGLAISPSDPQSLFASTIREGVFQSRDGGETWNQIGEGLPEDQQFLSIAVDDLERYVHVGTYNHGVWRLPLQQSSRRRPVRRE